MTPCMVRLAISAAHSSSIRYSELNGSAAKLRAGRGVAQIRRQPVAQRRHPGAEAGVRAVPTEQLSELPPDREERADGARGASRRIGRGHQLHQPREVVRAAGSRQRPHVLEPEVAGELVDPPGPGGVRGVREPHATSFIGNMHTCDCTYIQSVRLHAGRAQRPHARRIARVGRAGALALRLRQPRPRAGGERGRLHPRRALSPVQGQGGPRPGRDRVGRRDVEARGRPAASSRSRIRSAR